jgi:hypothetical protein
VSAEVANILEKYSKRADRYANMSQQDPNKGPWESLWASVSDLPSHWEKIKRWPDKIKRWWRKEPAIAAPMPTLERLCATQNVIHDKLKRLVHDPRPYESRAATIIETKRELFAINRALLEHIVPFDTYIQPLLDNIEIKSDGIYLKNGVSLNHLVNPDFLEWLRVDYSSFDLENDPHLQNEILDALFFLKEDINIAQTLRELHQNLGIDLNLSELNKICAIESEIATHRANAQLQRTSEHFLLSRLGKFIAGNYVISQIVSLGFMCALLTLAVISGGGFGVLGVIGIAVVGGTIAFCFMVCTGYANWWTFRDNTPNMLIEIWEDFFNPDDIPYTFREKASIGLAAFICTISGFIAGYFTYIFTIEGIALLFGSVSVVFPPFVIFIAIFAGLAIGLIFYKYAKSMALNSTILSDLWNFFKDWKTDGIKTAFNNFYNRLLNSDLAKFFRGVFLTDEKEILAFQKDLKDKVKESYRHYYRNGNLTTIVDKKVDDSILGVILQRNLLTLKTYDNPIEAAYYIKRRGRFITFIALVFFPLSILGIIYAQISTYIDLSVTLKTVLFAKVLEPLKVSIAMCVIAGLAYIPLFSKATIGCFSAIIYKGGTTDTHTKKVTRGEIVKYYAINIFNSSDNGMQSFVGKLIAYARENGKDFVEKFTIGFNIMQESIRNIISTSVLTLCSMMASFVSTGMPGDARDYEQELSDIRHKTIAARNQQAENAKRGLVQLTINNTSFDIISNDTTQTETLSIVTDPTLNIATDSYANNKNTLLLIPFNDSFRITVVTTPHMDEIKNSMYMDAIALCNFLCAYKKYKQDVSTSSAPEKVKIITFANQQKDKAIFKIQEKTLGNDWAELNYSSLSL